MKSANTPLMLIIPDVHGRAFWRSAVKNYPDIPVVFLGDYLDPYTHTDLILPSEAMLEFKDILKFKKQHSDRVTLLLGNHDVHYMDRGLNSSRKDWLNHDYIQQLFLSELENFKLADYVKANGKEFLLTHAGIVPEWLKLYFPTLDMSNTQLVASTLNNKLKDVDAFISFVKNGLMDISESRWGDADYPSMLWADLYDHVHRNTRLPNAYQIFGHTQLRGEPFIKEQFACLDCWAAFLLMENGEIVDAKKTRLG